MKGLATFCWFSSMKDISKDISWRKISVSRACVRIYCVFGLYGVPEDIFHG